MPRRQEHQLRETPSIFPVHQVDVNKGSRPQEREAAEGAIRARAEAYIRDLAQRATDDWSSAPALIDGAVVPLNTGNIGEGGRETRAMFRANGLDFRWTDSGLEVRRRQAAATAPAPEQQRKAA